MPERPFQGRLLSTFFSQALRPGLTETAFQAETLNHLLRIGILMTLAIEPIA